jgi:sortase A
LATAALPTLSIPRDALLRIPSLSLEVPVYSSTSELNLNRGAGHIEGTSPLAPGGNIGIAARRACTRHARSSRLRRDA